MTTGGGTGVVSPPCILTGARGDARFCVSTIVYFLLLVGVYDVVDGVIDAHAVERAPNEEDGNQNEDDAYPRSKFTEVLADGHFHGE